MACCSNWFRGLEPLRAVLVHWAAPVCARQCERSLRSRRSNIAGSLRVPPRRNEIAAAQHMLEQDEGGSSVPADSAAPPVTGPASFSAPARPMIVHDKLPLGLQLRHQSHVFCEFSFCCALT